MPKHKPMMPEKHKPKAQMPDARTIMLEQEMGGKAPAAKARKRKGGK